MNIAVAYEDGEIFQHFGRTEQFKLYDIEDGRIVKEQVIGTDGNGHGALAGFLLSVGADALICGGIGPGAQIALADAGITLYAGVKGLADDAAKAFIEGALEYNPDARCDHHENGLHHEHGYSHHCVDN